MFRPILFILLVFPFLAYSQYTLTGPRGMVNVPHAEVLEDETFMFGIHTNDEAYQLLKYGEDGPTGNEYISALTFGFLERFNLTLMLSRIFGDPMQRVGEKASIGDRSMQMTILMFKERKYSPSIVINITDPFYSTNQFLTGNHILASKTLELGKDHKVKGTLGYGIPYLMVFSGQEKRALVEKESPYLTHLFGGVSYKYLPANLQVSLEYDGWNVNSGLGITLWDRLSLQAYLQGMKHPGLGFNYVGTIH